MTPNWKTLKCISTILLAVSFWNVACQHKVFAQRPSLSFRGTVTDQHRVPLKGAVVEVQNVETNMVISYITGGDGRYRFKRLDGNTDYRIWAKVHGRRSKAKNLSHFDPSKATTINLTISFQ
jgi:hypothetical protein